MRFRPAVAISSTNFCAILSVVMNTSWTFLRRVNAVFEEFGIKMMRYGHLLIGQGHEDFQVPVGW